MSFIVKGIDLPEKENRMYMMELYADGHCSVAKIEDGECYELTIPSETEAIQIPKDHGRIGDLDELKADIHMNRLNKYATWRDVDATYRAIDDAPTILEAEEQ